MFKSFWENAVQIAAFTSVPASQHGYGMAVTDDDVSASLMDAVSNFGTAYAGTQETLQSNTANITAIQGQLQMLCQAIGNGQPPRVSSTINSAHVADAAADNNAVATTVVVAVMVVVATTLVVVTTMVATRP